jgi:hydroxymethylpyrimidine pyrophosphatase-like HAD family hydrolase
VARGALTFDAVAIDYDGTLAHDGVVDPPTVNALARGRDAGLRLVMVTGRELTDLFNTFSQSALFDRIVAENGAVLYEPGTTAVEALAPPPPQSLLERLTSDHVPFSSGHSIVATVVPYDQHVLTAIRDLDLDWHVIFNKGSVMALPANVTKATGLARALAALGIAHERTVGVGDAENDQAFLRTCGLAVAVANALPSVKAIAHFSTAAARGAGVAELIDRLIHNDLPEVPRQTTA